MSNVMITAQQLNGVAPEVVAMISNMKVGMNVLPGIGAGYASNEEDLEKMKMFVLGTMIAAAQSQQVDTPEIEDAEAEVVEDEDDDPEKYLESGPDGE